MGSCFRRDCQHAGDYPGASAVPPLLSLLLVHDMPLAWRISALTFRAVICKLQHVNAGVGKLWPMNQIWLATCFYTSFNGWREEIQTRIFHDMWKLYEIQIWACINKILLKNSRDHLFMCLQWCFCALIAELNTCDGDPMAHKALTIWLSIEKICWPQVKGSPGETCIKLTWGFWNWIPETHPQPNESESLEMMSKNVHFKLALETRT